MTINRVLSVAQARSQYLLRLSEAKKANSRADRDTATRAVKLAMRSLQQAQMTERIRGARRRIPRPLDWNAEIS